MRCSLAVAVAYMTGLFHCCTSINPGCDCVVYQSYGLSSGLFTSANFPEPYPPNINCILFSFIGDSTEIIQLKFLEFDLKMPEESGRCGDFLRVYMNLDRPEVNEYSKHDLEFCGGYSSIRNTIFSSGRSLVLEFHSGRSDGHSNYTGFKGTYKFLDKRNYITTGTRVPDKECAYDFYSDGNHHGGRFFSPGYPQDYKPLATCHYRFHAQNNERVNIEFTNIHLHHIDASCRDSPDVITVHDGIDEEAPVIGQFCGMHNGEEFISTGSSLYISFTCDDSEERQGFAATYTFVSKAIPSRQSKTPKGNPGRSGVPTTHPKFNCDENIGSRYHRNGTIASPRHPEAYPADINCRFIFTGVGRERIQLRFLHLDLAFPNGDPSKPVECKGSDSVSVYIIVNGKTEELDTWCGRKLPPMLMSSQHKMIVEFRSYHSAPTVTGFKAQYSFVTDFGIHGGEQDNRGTCAFNYRSTHRKSGKITSPNYHGLYPRNTECYYLFYGRENEKVRITFEEFEVDGISPRCEAKTDSDYVSFSNFADSEDRKMTRMCGQPFTREIESDGPFFRVVFKSNAVYDNTGFQAHYRFLSKNGERVGGTGTNGIRSTSSNDRAGWDNYYERPNPHNNHNSNQGQSKGAGSGGSLPRPSPSPLAAATTLVLSLILIRQRLVQHQPSRNPLSLS